MVDIYHQLTINESVSKVFKAISTSDGLDKWWSKSTLGLPKLNEKYTLNFGNDCIWKAIVSKFDINKEFQLTIVDSHIDWLHTKVGFQLINKGNCTEVVFTHSGWKEANEHFKNSSYCWAMYLRILKRYVEFGETVVYEQRY
ncbi:SRPBCC domain-containing protein [uncultured Psychroserpens sp.]|uniref:SRPBCC family protein n=1 Tax=uncultured Psychroserpens sp. TaxID=255436 RepID=UPI00260A4098|nr:SRPBCC domain-containing protein [uncultured Psychroserpens sp.]